MGQTEGRLVCGIYAYQSNDISSQRNMLSKRLYQITRHANLHAGWPNSLNKFKRTKSFVRKKKDLHNYSTCTLEPFLNRRWHSDCIKWHFMSYKYTSTHTICTFFHTATKRVQCTERTADLLTMYVTSPEDDLRTRTWSVKCVFRVLHITQ